MPIKMAIAPEPVLDDKMYMAEVSNLMLEGWKLLGITCPSPPCGKCALLRDKKGVIQCVKCKKGFVTHQESTKFFAAPPHPAYEDADPSDEKQRIDAATARMGELMLQGWAMLADNCPNPSCPGIPLMRKRGSKESICLLCDDVSSGPETLNTEPTFKPPKQKPPLPKTDTPLQKKRDLVSSKMGAKLLSGWTMLSENCNDPECNGTPLMSKGGSRVKVCVCCDKETGDESQSRSTINSSSSSSSSLSAALQAPSTHTFEEEDLENLSFQKDPSVSTMEQASGCVSEKLLQGWAMLETCCASCTTPLMKHAQGSNGMIVCVNSACHSCFMNLPMTSTKVVPVENNTISYEEVDDELEEALDRYKAKRFEVPVSFASQDSRILQQGIPHESDLATPSLRKKVKSDSMAKAKHLALEAVAQKLTQASERLMASNSVERDVKLSELIIKLANAAHALE